MKTTVDAGTLATAILWIITAMIFEYAGGHQGDAGAVKDPSSVLGAALLFV